MSSSVMGGPDRSLPPFDPSPRKLISVTGGRTFDELRDVSSVLVADDHLKIWDRRVGDPVEYRTADGYGLLAYVSEVVPSQLRLVCSFAL